ncbi:MAG TPA: DoxX family protein [Bacteroidia bacterium]|nr:DoxX family protein [Bacteroidia bacterium]
MEATFLQSAALLLVRLILGMLFFFQGYDKIFKIGINNVTDAAITPVTEKFFGKNFFKALIFVSSWTELLAGIMLTVGFQRDIWLVILGADMLGTALLFSILKPMWDMQYYFPRLVLLVLLMLMPESCDCYRIDSLLH